MRAQINPNIKTPDDGVITELWARMVGLNQTSIGGIIRTTIRDDMLVWVWFAR